MLSSIGMEFAAPKVAERAMILNAIAEKLKRQSKDDFKGRHFEAWLIVQAVTGYLSYPLRAMSRCLRLNDCGITGWDE
jgi:hypothetical protein